MVEIAKGELTGISWREQQDLVLTGMLSPAGTPFEVKLSKPVDQRLVNQIFEMLREGEELAFHGNTVLVDKVVNQHLDTASKPDDTSNNDDNSEKSLDTSSDSDDTDKQAPISEPIPGEHLQTVGKSDFDPKQIGEKVVQRLDKGQQDASVNINTEAEESINYAKPTSFEPTDFEENDDTADNEATQTIKYDANGHEVSVNDSSDTTDDVDDDTLPGL